MWPPGNSTYSRSRLLTTWIKGFTQPGGAILSSLALTASTGQEMRSSRTGRPPMVSWPLISLFCW